MKKLAGFLGVLAMVAVAPLARADFELTINGVDCNSGIAGTPSPTPGNFYSCGVITVSPGVFVTGFSTTATQDPAGSQQLSSTVSVQNTTGSSVTIMFGAAVSNYSSPTIPPFTAINDASSVTLDETLVGGGGATGTLTSCVDQSNALVKPTFCVTPAPGEAPIDAPVTVSGAQTNGDTTFGTITALTSPFSLSQELSLTLMPNASLNFTLTQALTPVPEPAAALFLGTVILGISTIMRKKAAKRS